jgi:CDP-6-deoxy-D-xylo-4-hexulose-3-dehydrase
MKNAFIRESKTRKVLSKFILSNAHLSMGEKCFEFEKEFAKYQGRKYAVLVNSGGSANLLLIQSLKNLGRIKDGDKVGFSALTWSTNVMPLISSNLIPIPIDVSNKTLNVMSDRLEESIINEKLQVLFTTNVLGFAGDLLKIKEICKKHNVILLEDSCEALGTEIDGIKTGNFGLASTFSFYVAHHMSTIEGGMVCTDDEELAMMLIMCRANGWDRNLPKNIQNSLRKKYGISDFYSKYAFYDIGMNVRPTEINGVLGLEQLKYIDKTLNKRERNFKKLNRIVKNNPELIPVSTDHLSFISNFSFPVISENIEKYIKRFNNEVEIRPLIAGNIIKQPFWAKYIKKDYNLSNTDYLHKNSFYFGNYSDLSKEDLQKIEELLK